jgi:hypothetical protein
MRLPPEYCQAAVQPDLALVPVLVTRIAPVKPAPQELLTTYVQLSPPVLAALLDALLLDAGTELGATLLLLLDAGTELGATLLLLLDAGAELGATLDVALPSIPQGAGWLVQVERPTQLFWFSQPQPLAVVTQTG